MFQLIKRTLFAGTLAIVPIALTFWILRFLFNFLDGFASPFLKNIGIEIPGLGIILTLLFIFLLGLFITNVLGKTIFNWGEKILAKLPIVNTIYNATKQITRAFSGKSMKDFKQVIFIQYPRKGLWAIAFITSETKGEVKNKLKNDSVNVFLPTTPNPTSGFLLMFPKDEIIFLDMTFEEASKFIISAGSSNPK